CSGTFQKSSSLDEPIDQGTLPDADHGTCLRRKRETSVPAAHLFNKKKRCALFEDAKKNSESFSRLDAPFRKSAGSIRCRTAAILAHECNRSTLSFACLSCSWSLLLSRDGSRFRTR